MTTIALMVWLGGLIPAYRHARNNGCIVIDALLLQAPIWPCDIGWHLADTYCSDHKK